MKLNQLIVLVIGSGGREHALVRKIAMSALVAKIYATGTNAGMEKIAEMVALDVANFAAVAQFCREHGVDLVVIGPEDPLANGLVDYLENQGINVFGPNQAAAWLEANKIEAKRFMNRHHIPTAPYQVFTDPQLAMDHIDHVRARGGKCVVKAPGLCAGKGVYVCQNIEEGMQAVGEIMIDKKHGPANALQILIEDCLKGREVSYLALVGGGHYLPLASSQDHKRLHDGDRVPNPNTGGMGTNSPAPIVTKELEEKIQRKIMEPFMAGLKAEGIHYKGIIYVGLMIVDGEPFVLEFNIRFGDPETQPILMRMISDLVPLLLACLDGTLDQHQIEWDERPAVCVVMASAGYGTGTPVKGKIISGLEEAGRLPDTFVFHAGTKSEGGQVVTNGGRVLGVTALGADIRGAIDNAYRAVSVINFDGAQYRPGIGAEALNN